MKNISYMVTKYFIFYKNNIFNNIYEKLPIFVLYICNYKCTLQIMVTKI